MAQGTPDLSELFWWCLGLLPVSLVALWYCMKWTLAEGVYFHTAKFDIIRGSSSNTEYERIMLKTGLRAAGAVLLIGGPVALWVQFG